MVSGTQHPSALLAHAIAKINRVPDRYRVFSESPGVAREVYRIDAALLAKALELGLPGRGGGANLRLDPLDLRNLAISLHLKVPWFMAMRWWATALERARTCTARSYRIGIASRCVHCTADDHGPFDTAPQLADAAHAVESSPDPAVDMYATVRLAGSPGALPSDIAELLRPADRVEWHLLPHALVADVGFLDETGLSDCRLMAYYLCEEARRHGLRARTAFGLFVTFPFSSEHQWVEFEVDGRWVPADPLLFNSLARWGYLDPAGWPPTTSLEGTVWRISATYLPLVLHGDVPADSALPTTRLPTTTPGTTTPGTARLGSA